MTWSASPKSPYPPSAPPSRELNEDNGSADEVSLSLFGAVCGRIAICFLSRLHFVIYSVTHLTQWLDRFHQRPSMNILCGLLGLGGLGYPYRYKRGGGGIHNQNLWDLARLI